jgi:hypothetical protein
MKSDAYTALTRLRGKPFHPESDFVLQPVLRHPHQRLAGQSNIVDILNIKQRVDELFQPPPREVRHVTT